jgi:hypothetical protein
METIGIILIGTIGLVGIIYLAIFLISPMQGVKKTPPAEVSKIPLPELSDRARIIVRHALEHFIRKEKIDLTREPLAIRRLYDAAIQAEKELSVSESSLIRLTHIVSDEWGTLNLELRVYRELFEGKK